MRWSATLIPTLKEVPSEAVALSHKLMLRAGMVRRVGSGSYSYLPLGTRALHKVIDIIRQEMDDSGAVEVLMPVLWPEDLMQDTGRLEAFSEDLVRFTDRHGRPHILAPTHEEVVTGIVGGEVKSYKQLPVILYQIHTKFRDEPRPRFGVLRTREFIMKDAYSFSADEASLDECYETMCAAYRRIMDRCGLRCVFAEAESGAMGGGESHEFMVPAAISMDSFVQCTACGYAANIERAGVPIPPETEASGDEPELREVETPGKTTIEAVSALLDVGPERMVKTLIYSADGRPVAILVRGDHEVNEAKLRRVLGVESLELADSATIEKVTGAPVGFAGPVGLEDVEIVSDHAVQHVRGAVTGANRQDMHLMGVVPGRDFDPGRSADVRFVTAGDACCRCGGRIRILDGIEVAHVFKLGTTYSDALGATFVDAAGRQNAYVMGCYGIGVNRIVAAIIESAADDKGVVWVPGVAPYDVLVMPLDMSEEAVTGAAEDAYGRLCEAGVDVLLDDRDERAGAKFKDADLIGIPLRVVVGKGYMGSGKLELQVRRDNSRVEAAPGDVVNVALQKLAELAPAVG